MNPLRFGAGIDGHPNTRESDHGRATDAKPVTRAVRAAATRSAPRAPPAPPPRSPTSRARFPTTRCSSEEGLALHRAQRRHHSRGDRHRFSRRSRGARDLEGGRRRRQGRARAFCRAACAARSCSASAPREFTQHARNPARSVVIGGKNTVFAPAYGSPFVRNLDEGRRYARIEDFRNFVKLAYMSQLAAPFGRHDLRAGRPAGQQAPPRHGVQPSEIQRQGVHGIGDRAGARRRFGGDGEHRVRRRALRSRHRPAEDDASSI